jgi:hypothetical protein
MTSGAGPTSPTTSALRRTETSSLRRAFFIDPLSEHRVPHPSMEPGRRAMDAIEPCALAGIV